MLSIDPISQQFARPEAAYAAPTRERETAALREFERLFLYELLGEMRKSVGEGGLFDRGGAMAIFEDMMDDAVAKQMASTGQLGIAAAIEAQLHQHDLQRGLDQQPEPKVRL